MSAKKLPFTADDLVMIAAFRNGDPAASIARRHGVRKSHVYSVLRRARLRPVDNMVYVCRKTPIDTQELIIAFYQEPRGLSETARRFGLAYGTVRKMLKRRGVLRTEGSHRVFPASVVAEMARRYTGGETQSAIAQDFNTAQTTVSQALRRAGVNVPKGRCTGSRHGAWKGGRAKAGGYIKVHIARTHPFYEQMADKDGYCLEHRLVMAEQIGRPLLRSETVHHIDGNREHNDGTNLQLRHGRHGKGVSLRCRHCGSHDIESLTL